MSVPLYQAKAELFRTLGHPVRIRVLELRQDGPKPVRDLLAAIDVEASNLSQQLAVLRDLTLFPDRLDPAAQVDRALVTLLPGESATFTVHAPGPLDADALIRRPVLRCVNDLV